MSLQDTYASRRGQFTSVLMKGKWGFNSTFSLQSYSLFIELGNLMSKEESLLTRYQNIYSQKDWNILKERVLSLREELTPYESLMMTSPHATYNLSASTYFAKNTAVLTALRDLESEVYHKIVDENHTYYVTNLSQMIAGLSIIVLFVFPLCFLIFWTARITYKPIIQQRRNLETASEIANAIIDLDFKSEVVTELREKPLQQCDSLEKALRKVLDNFFTYMPYIPRHLLVKDSDSDDDEGDAEVASVVTSSSSKLSGQSAGRQSHSTHNSSKNSSGARKRFSHISKRYATVMVVDITDFCRISTEMSFEGLSTAYSDFLTVLSDAVLKTNGVVQSFSSGIFICSWNAAGKVFDPEVKASSVALELVNSAFSNPKLSFRMKVGIASGETSVGELGNSEMRAFQTIGAPMTRALALSKLCHQYSCSIAVDQNTQKSINFENDLKQLDFVHFPGSTVGESIFQLVRSKNLRNNEWLYERAQSEKLSTFSEYNAAWKSILRGDFTKARERLNTFKEELDKTKNQGDSSVNTEFLEDIILHGCSDSSSAFRYKCVCSNWTTTNNVSRKVK